MEAIREYLSGIIENKEKKGKTADYVKIHETEKNNLIRTSNPKVMLSTVEQKRNDYSKFKLAFSMQFRPKSSFSFIGMEFWRRVDLEEKWHVDQRRRPL